MARLIDADALKEELKKIDYAMIGYHHALIYTEVVIDNAPTIDQVRHGRWEYLWAAEDGTYKGRCKDCGFVRFFIEGHDAQYNFCPNCGAKMDGDE